MKITARSLVGRLAPFALLGYPRLTGRPSLVGPHTVSTIRTRIAGCEAQVLYPTDGKDGVATRYARNELPAGLAEYSRLPQILFTHLAVRRHPCIEGADPLTPDGGYPLVVFSHGLGGCIEMYTGLCASVASLGHVVIALEHTDGSACFARDDSGAPIAYKRYKANAADMSNYQRFGPNSDYSKQRLVSFRAPFLATRTRELRGAIDHSTRGRAPPASADGTAPDGTAPDGTAPDGAAPDGAAPDGAAPDGTPSGSAATDVAPLMHRVLATIESSRVHLLGHSFGAASVMLAAQQLDEELQAREAGGVTRSAEATPPPRVASVSLLDPWLSSAGQAAVERGLRPPVLAALSRGWCDGHEANLTRVLAPVAAYCLPLAQHTSFSDAPNWFPGLVTRRAGLRGPKEPLRTTHADVALAIAAHISGSRGMEKPPVPAPDHSPAVPTAWTMEVALADSLELLDM